MKVVVANSVGKDAKGNHFIHFPSRWTACVGRIKDFTYYPYELAYLSSLLKKRTNLKVKMVDGNLLQLNAEEYFDLLLKEEPDWLIMETSTAVYSEDLKLASAIKRHLGTKIIFTGQHPTAFPQEVLADGVDFVCRGEYELTVLALLQGKDPRIIKGLYPNPSGNLVDLNQLPLPEDKDISRLNYAGISGCDYKEIELFASRGCPLSCIFCVCGNLYYNRPNWRPRNINEIISEINYLKERYPEMEGIFFDEEQHNGNKQFVHVLSEEIVKHKLNRLKFSAMCNYWNLDAEILRSMKQAGYYKLRIGIETASIKVADTIRKPINIQKLKEVLREAKKAGIRMYGTFIFGAPGSSREEDTKTIRLLYQLITENLLSDFQSSICVPQPGTPFYQWAEENGYLTTKDWRKYDGYRAVVSYPHYPKEAIEEIFQLSWRVCAAKRIKRLPEIPYLVANRLKRYGFSQTARDIFRTLRTHF